MLKAIEKINAEMQKEPDNQYLEILGHYIIDRCSDPKVSQAINNGKTLKGAFEAVKSAAKKKGSGCVVMKDNDIYDAVDKYLEAETDQEARLKSKASVDGGTAPKKAASINLDFDSMF